MNSFQKIAVENIKENPVENIKENPVENIKENPVAIMHRGKFCIEFDQAAAFRKLFPSEQDRTNFLLSLDRKSSLCDNSKRF